jgi:hypothetical protein
MRMNLADNVNKVHTRLNLFKYGYSEQSQNKSLHLNISPLKNFLLFAWFLNCYLIYLILS